VLLAGCTVEGCRGDPVYLADARQYDARPLPDAEQITEECSPTAQTGSCSPAHERCTWVRDQDSPPIGHIGCVPQGHIAIGAICTEPAGGPMGYDDCVQGSVCSDGVCAAICDNDGGIPGCDADHACVIHEGLFEYAGSTVAGVCEVGCDPLTQKTKLGASTDACGSTTPAAPDRGCYGFDNYSCDEVLPGANTLTDRKTPKGNASGNPYFNGCAPGFMPIFYEGTGSTKSLCTGLCAALETDNTPAHMNNGKGDPTALAKLPNESASAPGNATCDIGRKGSEDSSRCHFLWPLLVNDDGSLPVSFANGPLRDTLGVCMAIDHFMYDSNNDMHADTPYPDCATLPPHSAATPGLFDDASDWGCQKFANTPHPTQLARGIRIGFPEGALPLIHHELQ
jgi:hypothetical protein